MAWCLVKERYNTNTVRLRAKLHACVTFRQPASDSIPTVTACQLIPVRVQDSLHSSNKSNLLLYKRWWRRCSCTQTQFPLSLSKTVPCMTEVSAVSLLLLPLICSRSPTDCQLLCLIHSRLTLEWNGSARPKVGCCWSATGTWHALHYTLR
jgi:hypothetical protein